jgi:RNA polymerase sigma-70 factor, ECF subfamily
LLVAWRGGDVSALAELVPIVDRELRRLARGYLSRERPDHVLQTTALVNEAFMRLLTWKEVSWQNRAHFLAMSARLMRNALIDLSRRRPRGSDGKSVVFVQLSPDDDVATKESPDLVALDDALRELARLDHRKAQIVELRFFGGLTLEEIAEVIQVAPITVSREWAKARDWLRTQVSESPRSPPSAQ